MYIVVPARAAKKELSRCKDLMRAHTTHLGIFWYATGRLIVDAAATIRAQKMNLGIFCICVTCRLLVPTELLPKSFAGTGITCVYGQCTLQLPTELLRNGFVGARSHPCTERDLCIENGPRNCSVCQLQIVGSGRAATKDLRWCKDLMRALIMNRVIDCSARNADCCF